MIKTPSPSRRTRLKAAVAAAIARPYPRLRAGGIVPPARRSGQHGFAGFCGPGLETDAPCPLRVEVGADDGFGRARQAQGRGDLRAAQPLSPQLLDLSDALRRDPARTSSGRRAAIRDVLARPPKRSAQTLATSPSETPAVCAGAATDHPSSRTRETIDARPCGLVRAFLRAFIQSLPGQELELRNPSLSAPDEQPS